LVGRIKQDIIFRRGIFGRLSLALEKDCQISVMLLLFSFFISIVSSLVFVFSSVIFFPLSINGVQTFILIDFGKFNFQPTVAATSMLYSNGRKGKSNSLSLSPGKSKS